MMTSATRVRIQLIESIIAMTPRTVTAEETSCIRLWLRVWLITSTSFVILDKSSP